MDISGTAGLAVLAAPSQQARLIQLQALPQAWSWSVSRARNPVCGGNRFEIDCLSTDAFLDMDPWLEQPVSLQLRQADGGQRPPVPSPPVTRLLAAGLACGSSSPKVKLALL